MRVYSSNNFVLLIKYLICVRCVTVFGELNNTFRLGNKTVYISKEPAIWDDAKKFCKDNQMDLLSIRSVEEANIIGKLKMPPYFWSGGNNIENPSVWTWSGKSKNYNRFVYTNWAIGHPHNPRGDHCVAIYNYFTWRSYFCANKLIFMCEYVDDVEEARVHDLTVVVPEFEQKPNDSNSKRNEIPKVVNTDCKVEYPIPNIYEIIKESMQKNGNLFTKVEAAPGNESNVKIEFYYVKNLIIAE